MAEHEKSTDVAPHGGFRRCSTHRCRNRAVWPGPRRGWPATQAGGEGSVLRVVGAPSAGASPRRSEEHTSELQSLTNLVCRLLLEKKKTSWPYVPAKNHSQPPIRS